MKDRILALRKSLNLTQQAFADRLSIKRGAVANYELGRNIPADSVVALICREFGVREEWLREGIEPMKDPAVHDPLEEAVLSRGYSRRIYILVNNFLKLPQESQEDLISFMESVAADLAELPTSGAPPDDRAFLHAELDRQLDEEEKGASSA